MITENIILITIIALFIANRILQVKCLIDFGPESPNPNYRREQMKRWRSNIVVCAVIMISFMFLIMEMNILLSTLIGLAISVIIEVLSFGLFYVAYGVIEKYYDIKNRKAE